MKISNLCLFFIATTLLRTLEARPTIIGIISFYSEGWNGHSKSEWNYIAASYVKWLQTAGAQVVPIQWDMPFDQIEYLLDRVNGVVFTGGNIRVHVDGTKDPSPIYLAFKRIAEYILQKNKNSEFYPLWGTCMGFWNIARVLADDMEILTSCEDCVYVPRDVFPGWSYKSKMLKYLPFDLRTKIQTDELNVFLHNRMITPEIFETNSRLSHYFTPVAYSYDESGEEYVSMAESRRYPIYGTQFHPEKPEFENKERYDIPHTRDAIRFGRYLADFFVGEARKNFNIFPNSERYLIENYSTEPVHGYAYEEVYYFPSYSSLSF